MIVWEKYDVPQQFHLIEDIVGTCMMWEKDHYPVGEFKLDTGGGGFIFSLFVTWKRADPTNKFALLDIMMEMINKYKIDEKVRQIHIQYPSAAKMSHDYLKKSGIKL